MSHTRPSRNAFITATVAAAVALLAITIALAANARPASQQRPQTPSVARAADILEQLTPPPGAALLLIVGLLAARRGHR